jgi:hypothetical protein
MPLWFLVFLPFVAVYTGLGFLLALQASKVLAIVQGTDVADVSRRARSCRSVDGAITASSTQAQATTPSRPPSGVQSFAVPTFQNKRSSSNNG